MKRMKMTQASIMGFLFINLVLFQNCGQQVDFAELSDSQQLKLEDIVLVDDSMDVESFNEDLAIDGVDSLAVDGPDDKLSIDDDNLGLDTPDQNIIEDKDEAIASDDSEKSESVSEGDPEQNLANEESVVSDNLNEDQQQSDEVAIDQNKKDDLLKEEASDESSVAADKSEETTTEEQVASDKGDEVEETVADINEEVFEQPKGKRKEAFSKKDSSQELVNEDNSFYRCVVKGPGKSKHISFDGSLGTDIKGTPETICMSEVACLEILASVFDVVEAKYTGYCKNDKAHTRQMSDAEAAGLVDEILK